jgi:hypothetical protein
MESHVECSHCGILMTSWCAAGSPTRYYQCPFCKRTLCSAYGEVFERGVLARRLAPGPRPGTGPVPEPTAEDRSWRELKGRAARWFARIEAENERHALQPAVAVARARA